MRLLFYFQFVITCACLALLGGCEPGAEVAEKVAAARARNDGPPIWVVKDADSTLYLYGTVHLLPSDMDWQKKDMRDAFASAGTVFFEVPSNDKARLDASVLVTSLGLYNNGESLSDRLDNYQKTLLAAAAHNSQLDSFTINTMRPWLASEFLTVAAAAQAGLSAGISADEALKSHARREKKNTLYLETVATQIKMSATQSDAVQMAILTDTLIHFNKLGEDMRRVALAWTAGSTEFLETEIIEMVKSKSPEFYQSVFVDRNAAWAARLDNFMRGSDTGFAAIGIGHLLGEDSLRVRLREKGYRVHRFYAFQGEPVIRPLFPKDETR